MTFKKPNSETAFLISEISKRIDALSEKKSAHEKWGAIFANWSQVAMLLIVLFGYIYTVLPVVQKEQIAEQLAALEIEKKNWDKKFNDTRSKIDEKNIELQKLQQSKKLLLKDITTLNLEKNKITETLHYTRSEFTRISTELKKAKTNINSATNALLVQNKQSLLGNITINENILPIIDNSWGIHESFTYHNQQTNIKLKESYPLPLKYANKILTRLYDSYNQANGIDRSAKYKLYNQYKSGIAKHQNSLTCPTPNFEAWEASFSEARHLISSLIPSCIEDEFEKTINKEIRSSDKVLDLEKTQLWTQQEKTFKSLCELRLEFRVGDVFRNEWEKMAAPCEERLLKVSNIVLGESDPAKLRPFTDFSPPSNEFINHKLNLYRIDHYPSRSKH